jgi:hypothetical protein
MYIEVGFTGDWNHWHSILEKPTGIWVSAALRWRASLFCCTNTFEYIHYTIRTYAIWHVVYKN